MIEAMSDIIAKLAAAIVPDSKIDVAVHEAAGLQFVMEYWSDSSTEQTRNLSYVPRYTASVDAAIALAEMLLPGCRYASGKRWDRTCFASVGPTHDTRRAVDAMREAPTEPLAILLALFVALETVTIEGKLVPRQACA